MSKGVISCLLGSDFNDACNGELFHVLIQKTVDAATLQTQDPFSILFKDSYLKANITEQNKFVNQSLAKIKGWVDPYLENKIEKSEEKLGDSSY